jgi:hypothetical protein
MYSVGLLYSVRDFLKLNSISGMSPIEFETHFKSFRYSTADKIMSVAFKCGWTSLTPNGYLQLTIRGQEIANLDYQDALLFQLEDLILNYNPPWASLIVKGRSEARNFLPPDVLQCFSECGLFGPLTNELIKFWDKLSLAYRNYANKKRIEIGRLGEKFSFDFEFTRCGVKPLWQSIESNSSGFDILSIIGGANTRKLKIEVKSTTNNLEYATFHLTKNEWNTAESSIDYLFHMWVLNSTPSLNIVSVDEMKNHIPIDHGSGSWESVEIPFKILGRENWQQVPQFENSF